MTDEERPNANYNLSKPNNAPGEESLTFHYNREKRLAKSSKAVNDLYSEQKHSGFNLLRPLIADKPRSIIFFSIVVLCLTILMLSVLGFFDKAFKLEGNKIEITGTIFEGTTIIRVKKTIDSKQSVYTGAVDIAVSPPAESEDEQYRVYYHRIFFTLQEEEEYRFAAPFDTPELLLVLQTEKSTLRVKIKPD